MTALKNWLISLTKSQRFAVLNGVVALVAILITLPLFVLSVIAHGSSTALYLGPALAAAGFSIACIRMVVIFKKPIKV